MKKRTRFMSFVIKEEDKTQSIYLGVDALLDSLEEIVLLGATNILVVCDNSIVQTNHFKEIMDLFNEIDIKVNIFTKKTYELTNQDVNEGLKVYKEFHCDTVLAIGDEYSIGCAKLITALASGTDGNIMRVVGVDKVKSEVPLLIVMAIDANISISSNYAEFKNETDGKWYDIISDRILPRIVIYGNELFSHTSLDKIANSITIIIATAIEAYMSPLAEDFPEYKAAAMTSYIELLMLYNQYSTDYLDVYYQQKLLVAAFYAGIAMRKLGLGYTHIITRTIMRYSDSDYHVLFSKVFQLMLQEYLCNNFDVLAELSKEIGHSKESKNNKVVAIELVEGIKDYIGKLSLKDATISYDSTKINKAVATIQKIATQFGINQFITEKTLYDLLNTLS